MPMRPNSFKISIYKQFPPSFIKCGKTLTELAHMQIPRESELTETDENSEPTLSNIIPNTYFHVANNKLTTEGRNEWYMMKWSPNTSWNCGSLLHTDSINWNIKFHDNKTDGTACRLWTYWTLLTSQINRLSKAINIAQVICNEDMIHWRMFSMPSVERVSNAFSIFLCFLCPYLLICW